MIRFPEHMHVDPSWALEQVATWKCMLKEYVLVSEQGSRPDASVKGMTGTGKMMHFAKQACDWASR